MIALAPYAVVDPRRVPLTRSRISCFMSKFRKLDFIEYNGTLKVHSSVLNVIVHDWLRPIVATRIGCTVSTHLLDCRRKRRMPTI